MNRSLGWILVAATLTLQVVSFSGLGQDTAAPLGVVPTPIPTPIEASIWTDKSSYAVGEDVTILFSVNQPAYVYVYDIQPDGLVRLIFPNAFEQGNYVSAGGHALPNGLYKFTVQPPAGTERLQIFASPSPLNLSPTAYQEPFPLVGSDPQAAASQIEAEILGISPELAWTTAWTSFTIMQQYGYTPPTTSPPTYYIPPSTTPPTYYTPPTPNPYQQPNPYLYPYFFYSSQQPPFSGYPGATYYLLGGQWHSGIPSSGSYWYWNGGTWRIRVRISFRFGVGSNP